MTHDFAVDMLFPHASGDQLGVLRSEVEYDHPFGLLGVAQSSDRWGEGFAARSGLGG
jgi:hypothetical protein